MAKINSRFVDGLSVAKGAREAGWLFGKPSIHYSGTASYGGWSKSDTSPLNQKGGGWLANLYGGAQSGDDWASLYIPVNELPVTQLETANWSWYQTNAESMGLGCVIWVHDPDDFDKRAEITQLGGVAGLEHAAGWNAHEFDSTDAGMFFYGEGTTGTDLTAGTQYTWAQFQADALFSTWSIYRISWDWGWEASGTFEDAWLAEVKINGVYIPLYPSEGETIGGPTKTLYVATSGTSTTKATAITPSSVFKKIRIKAVSMATASSTAAIFEVYFGTGANITSTPANAICMANLDTDSVVTDHFEFGDDGPLGAVNTVVSIRTSADITTNGYFVFNYREE